MIKAKRTVITRLAVIFFLTFITSQSLATVPRTPVSASVVEYGIYEDHGHQQKYTSPGTAAGTVSSATEQIRLLKLTQEVPLRKGIMFGYKWRLHGLTPGKSLIITYRIKHPPIINLKGVPTEMSEGKLKATPRCEVFEMINAYQLSKDSELVPGTWTITTLLEGQIIAEMTFHVVAH